MVKLISAPPLSLCLVSSDNACWYEMTCVIKKKKPQKNPTMCGVLHILKTPEDSSCVSEGNQPPRARQRKSSKQHTQREARVPPQLYRDSLVKAKYDPYV